MIPPLHLYGFFIALALLALYLYSQKRAQLYRLKPKEVESALLVSIIFALIGARIYHIFSSFSYYQDSPLKIFFLWEGGLGIFGAITGGIFGLFLYCRRQKAGVLNFLNLMAPPLLLAQAVGRLGNFFNHESFGPPTNLPWKIYIPAVYRPIQFSANDFFHPTFFHESILCLLAFFVFILLPKRFQVNFGFAFYLIAYGSIRFLTEFFRWDTWQIYSWRLGHLLSLSLIVVGLFLFYRSRRRKQ